MANSCSRAWRCPLCSGTAGLGARAFPLLVQQALESSRIRAEEADIERIVGRGLGPMDAGDEDTEVCLLSRLLAGWGVPCASVPSTGPPSHCSSQATPKLAYTLLLLLLLPTTLPS